MFRRRVKSDSAVASMKLKKNRQQNEQNQHHQKQNSAPRGILKYVSADESLHSVYGSDVDASNRSCASAATSSNSSSANNNGGGRRGNNNNNSSKQLNRSRSVIFTAIEIREYARTVGDNPSCSSGPPISIAWDYDPETKTLSIDDYESRRPARRASVQMVLPRDVRDFLLRKEWDVSRGEIASAIRESIKIKNQRRQTVNNLGKDKVEEMMERAGKKLMRGLLLKSSTSTELHKLEQQYQAAEQARKQQQLFWQMADEPVVGDDDNEDLAGQEGKENEAVEVAVSNGRDDSKTKTAMNVDSPTTVVGLSTTSALLGGDGAEEQSVSISSRPVTIVEEDDDHKDDDQNPQHGQHHQCKGEDTAESDDSSSGRRSRNSTTGATATTASPKGGAAASASKGPPPQAVVVVATTSTTTTSSSSATQEKKRTAVAGVVAAAAASNGAAATAAAGGTNNSNNKNNSIRSSVDWNSLPGAADDDRSSLVQV